MIHPQCDHVLLVICSYCVLNEGIAPVQQLKVWKYVHCCADYRGVENYISRPQEVCEDVFVLMQRLAITAGAEFFLLQRFYSRHTISWGGGGGQIPQKLNTNNVQFLPAAAPEAATHL